MFTLKRRGQGFLVLAFFFLTAIAFSQQTSNTFTNPLTTTDAADPAVVRVGEKLYLYVTGRGKDGGNFPIYQAPVPGQGPWEWVANVFTPETRLKWSLEPTAADGFKR